MTDDVRFAARRFHLAQRLQCSEVAFEPGPYIRPCDLSMSVHVHLKASLEDMEQIFSFLCVHG